MAISAGPNVVHKNGSVRLYMAINVRRCEGMRRAGRGSQRSDNIPDAT